jgi:PPOX class probable F420-dependent enzyme
LSEELREFLSSQPVGVLATLASDGKPRQSLVYFALDGDRLLISTLTDRLKARDARRSGWASLCVMGHERPYPSATFSGAAEILTQDIGPLTAKIMQRIAQSAEPPEPMTDEVLAQAGRVVLAIQVDRVSAASHIPGATDSSGGS